MWRFLLGSPAIMMLTMDERVFGWRIAIGGGGGRRVASEECEECCQCAPVFASKFMFVFGESATFRVEVRL